jgi:hypothetical protein
VTTGCSNFPKAIKLINVCAAIGILSVKKLTNILIIAIDKIAPLSKPVVIELNWRFIIPWLSR